NNDANISPASAADRNFNFAPNGNSGVTIPASPTLQYYFKSWKQTGSGTINITAPATIYINGDFTMSGGGILKINSTGNNVVKFIVNGNFNQSGGTIINTG